MSFCKNVSGVDRAIRIVVGAALLTMVFTGPGVIWGWIGLVPLITGLVGFCPAYTLFGKGSK